jgi:hypothetical protein
MAIGSADKIFVDVNDEINFVVEKFLQSESSHVILICPQHALVISSQVSIKILAHQMLKSKKLLILVTEDAFGVRIAENAGLLVTSKVSKITPELWDQAAQRKEMLQEQQKERKQDLLAERGLVEPRGEAGQTKVADPVLAAIAEAATSIEETPTSDDSQMVKSDAENDTEVEKDDIIGPIQRTRPTAKYVQVGKLKILAAGDIAEEEMANDTEDNLSKRQAAAQSQFRGGFTGRDWAKYTQDKDGGFFDRVLKALPFSNKQKTREQLLEEQDNSGRGKVILGGSVLAVVLALVGIYLVLFRFASVDVFIELEKEEVPVEQTIRIDTALNTIDTEKIILPAIAVEVDDLTGSKSGKADGVGFAGEKSTGLIEIWNKTTSQVTLNAGTVLQANRNGKKYTLTAKVVLPAAEASDDDNVTGSFGTAKDVRIQATDLGPEFDLDASEAIDFTIAGFTLDQIVGKGFSDIEGGTKEQFVAVSKDNFNKVKKEITESLVNQGKELLQTEIPDGYRLIPGTEKFTEEKADSIPKQGEEAAGEAKEFSVNVTGKLSALAVAEEDLQKAVELLILKNQETDSELAVANLDDAEITQVSRTDGTATFVLSSRGSLQGDVSVEGVKNLIAGMGMEEADSKLAALDGVKSFRIVYSPVLVPGWLRWVPADTNSISVTLQ